VATQFPAETVLPQTGPGEHAGENWRSSGRGVEGRTVPRVAKQGVETRLAPSCTGWRKTSQLPTSHRPTTNWASSPTPTRRSRSGAVATPTSSKPRPTSDTRDAKNDNEGGWIDHVRLDQTGTEDRPAGAGLYELWESHNPSSKVVTKEVVTTEN
jgi:hypothetical protein